MRYYIFSVYYSSGGFLTFVMDEIERFKRNLLLLLIKIKKEESYIYLKKRCIISLNTTGFKQFDSISILENFIILLDLPGGYIINDKTYKDINYINIENSNKKLTLNEVLEMCIREEL